MVNIVNDLLDFFPEEIEGQPGTLDEFGTWLASGTSEVLPARYEGRVRTVPGPGGQDLVSTLSCFVAGTPAFRPDTWRYTIPSRFTPNADLIAIAVMREADEVEEIYLEILFP